MRATCAYCGRDIGNVEPFDDDAVTHGMCQACFDHFAKQECGELKMGEFLDRFEVPVLALDTSVRVIAANQAMVRLLGKKNREVSGLLGGDVMECVYALRPGGCGNTIHCRDCTIREAVTETVETGRPKVNVDGYIERFDGRLECRISTELINEFPSGNSRFVRRWLAATAQAAVNWRDRGVDDDMILGKLA